MNESVNEWMNELTDDGHNDVDVWTLDFCEKRENVIENHHFLQTTK